MLICSILTAVISLASCIKYKVVKTNYGTIYGRKNVFNRKIVSQFLGIPYAEQPIGLLRFQPPRYLKKPAWKGILMADRYANSCPQALGRTGFIGYDILVPSNHVSEDCLQLNIWVPEKKNVPVLVFFHGGAYNFGSGSLKIHDGSFIARRTNQIVVTINYRLGALGFSYLGQGAAIPGNIGLLDQQAGLKWVYENIKHFGGNKKKITIWGHSAGSASATAHLFAPNSHKYFSKVIANSGTIRNIWATIDTLNAEANTRAMASKLNCKGNDEEILRCLQKTDIKSLLLVSLSVKQPDQPPVFYSFAPVDTDDKFFKGSLKQKIFLKDMKKNVDLWIGKTTNEGTYFMPSLLGNEKFKCYLDPNYSVEDPRNSCNLSEDDFNSIVYLNLKPYLQKPEDLAPIFDEYEKLKIKNPRDRVGRFLSDVSFDCDIIEFADEYAALTDKNVFFYHFNKSSTINPFPKWMGRYHGIELEFEFMFPFLDSDRYENKAAKINAFKYSARVLKQFEEFNKNGNPGSLWKKYEGTKPLGGVFENGLTYNGPRRSMPVKTGTCKALKKLFLKFYSSQIKG